MIVLLFHNLNLQKVKPVTTEDGVFVLLSRSVLYILVNSPSSEVPEINKSKSPSTS